MKEFSGLWYTFEIKKEKKCINLGEPYLRWDWHVWMYTIEVVFIYWLWKQLKANGTAHTFCSVQEKGWVQDLHIYDLTL